MTNDHFVDGHHPTPWPIPPQNFYTVTVELHKIFDQIIKLQKEIEELKDAVRKTKTKTEG